jgi:hypothetical protein
MAGGGGAGSGCGSKFIHLQPVAGAALFCACIEYQLYRPIQDGRFQNVIESKNRNV